MTKAIGARGVEDMGLITTGNAHQQHHLPGYHDNARRQEIQARRRAHLYGRSALLWTVNHQRLTCRDGDDYHGHGRVQGEQYHIGQGL